MYVGIYHNQANEIVMSTESASKDAVKAILSLADELRSKRPDLLDTKIPVEKLTGLELNKVFLPFDAHVIKIDKYDAVYLKKSNSIA